MPSVIDNSAPKSLDRPNYRRYNRTHREALMMSEHERNLARSVQRVEEMQRRKKTNKYSQETPALIARKSTPQSQSHYKYLYAAESGIAPQRELARHMGGAEDLLHELGADKTPLSRLRVPQRPLSAAARLANVEKVRGEEWLPSSAPSAKERCVLWGTSLAEIPAVEAREPKAAVQCRLRGKAQELGGNAGAGVSARGGDVGATSAEGLRVLAETRKKVLDTLVQTSWCTEEKVMQVIDDTWKKILVVHRPALLELLCSIMQQLNIPKQKISDFRKRVAPPGSAASKGFRV